MTVSLRVVGRWVLLLGALCACLPAGAKGKPPDPERIARLVEEGYEFLARSDAIRARRAFQKANALSDGRSPEAAFGLARAHLSQGDYEEAISRARDLMSHMPAPEVQAPASQLIGIALLARTMDQLSAATRRESDDACECPPSDEDLLAAETALLDAIALSEGTLNAARYYLAEVLARQWRSRDALTTLNEYLDRGVDPGAEQPARALHSWLECAERVGPIRREPYAEPPALLRKVQPEFPEPARQAGGQGVVVVASVVDTDGSVACVHPWSQAPAGLAEAAMAAIREWEYAPVLRDGQPVPFYHLIVVEFVLK